MVRFANIEDIDKIMQFIDIYWQEGHILGQDKIFFQYEHVFDKEVTYVISENSEKQIDAILGYIPYGKRNRDIMTVMWKANHTANPSLGLDLFYFLQQNADVRIVASPGSNKKLRGLYTYLGYVFGQMTQWYRLRQLNEYKIAKIVTKDIPGTKCFQSKFIRLDTWKEVNSKFNFDRYYNSNPKPLKEAWYIKKRYFDHPVYKYDIWGAIDETGQVSTLFVVRPIKINGSCALRLIDCIGDTEKIRNMTTMVDKLLIQYNAEYIDCYEAGVPDDLFESSGWIKTGDTNNIIPNYFAPFEQRNIDIYYFTTDPGVQLFKGDGDQDRPN